MFGGQFGWDTEAGMICTMLWEEDTSDISSLRLRAGPRNIAAELGWCGFLYTLLTCVDKNPRLMGNFAMCGLADSKLSEGCCRTLAARKGSA